MYDLSCSKDPGDSDLFRQWRVAVPQKIAGRARE